jgi:integrase
MNKTLKVHFYPKKRSGYQGDKLPIYLRLTIDGDRTEFAIQREVDPLKWNYKSGRLITTKKAESRHLNSFLETMQSQIYEAQRELLNSGREVSVTAIRNKLFKTEQTVINPLEHLTLLQVFRDHIKEVSDLVGKEYSLGTLKRFKAAFSALEAYLVHKKMGDIKLKVLSYKFITGYELFLKTVRNVEHNTAMGIIKKLKKIIRICVANDWIVKDPFMNYKVKIRDTNRPFLLQEELDRIMALKFVSDRLKSVCDIFLFSCYTGLAYADVHKLKPSHVVIGNDGEKWIHTDRVKTQISTRIPLLPQALEIIHSYQDHPLCLNQGKLLPVISNQKINEYLKEIADRCEISKKMTFHTARHTFATTVTLTNGVPIETVSKMLGHRNLRTTQLYAKILDTKISEDMKALRGRLQNRACKIENAFAS